MDKEQLLLLGRGVSERVPAPEPGSSTLFLYSIVKLQWGFIVRQPGATAAQSAYVIPPPTTVVGAFANPLARVLDVPDYLESRARPRLPVQNRYMECLLSSTIAASAGVLPAAETGVAVYEEPSRIMGTPYKTGGDYQKAVKQPIYVSGTTLLPVQAVGAASAPNTLLALAWVLDLQGLATCLERIGVRGRLGREELERAAWSVYRVGSREGIAVVEDAGLYGGGELEVIGEGGFESILYQPADCVETTDTGYTARVTLLGLDYREEEYLVPSGGLGGASALTPPPRPLDFYLSRPGCKAVGPRDEKGFFIAFHA